MRKLLLLTATALALATSVLASAALAGPPSVQLLALDETTYLPFTSQVCGFDVFLHVQGTLTEKTSTNNDGSLRVQLIANPPLVNTIYAPSTGKSVVTRSNGSDTTITYSDGSSTVHAGGTDGNITVPGQGIVYASGGQYHLEISPSGEVTVITDTFDRSTNYAGVCPLLTP